MFSTGHQPKTSNENEEVSLIAMQLASASIVTMVFKAAIELDVFEIIAKAGPGAHLSPSEIASHLPTQNSDAPAMIDRILRLLASYSLLTCSLVTHDNGHVHRLYGLAPISMSFVRNQDGVSWSPVLQFFQDKVFMESWHYLKDAVLEGGTPFNKAYGMYSYEYTGTDPRFSHLFDRAMFNYTSLGMKNFLETYKGFEDVKEVVDVGGGIGSSLKLITSKYPTINGINFDLPHVIQNAPSYPGVKHVSGDMFKSVPEGEIIFMKGILHDWDDDHCLKLLKNCYKALPDHGKVVMVDGIHPMAPETNLVAKNLCHFDLIMMAQHQGAKERSEEELELLAKEAGFSGIRLVCRVFFYWVTEFYKKDVTPLAVIDN